MAWPKKPPAFDGWCESPRGSLLFELVSTSGWLAGWPCFSALSPHPLAYQPRNTVDILTSQSLFTNYFTHYGSHCAQPHPVHLVSGIKINLSIQERLRDNIKLQIQHNIIITCCIFSHSFLRRQYHEAI